MAPLWIATWKVATFSPVNPRSELATIRCPVEEIGRNSVSPSAMPRMAALSSVSRFD
jgi:hypothetical protein